MSIWLKISVGNVFDKRNEKLENMSEEKEIMNENITPEENVSNDVVENEVQNETKEQSFEEKYLDVNDRFVRLYAEFENFRKRTNKEKVDLISNASAGVLKDLLPIIDDFERAISNNENVEESTVLKEGFSLIYNKFKGILEQKGLKAMEAKGESFDSELHEAIANIPAPSEDLKGKVVDDVEKGYFLHDKVIRFAKVVVGQ